MLGSCRYALGCCVGKYPPKPPAWLSQQPVPDFASVLANSVESVGEFWEEGAFLDLARYGNICSFGKDLPQAWVPISDEIHDGGNV